MNPNKGTRRRGKKIYRTVIKITPGDTTGKGDIEPKIEIDSTPLRPKVFGKKLRPKKPQKTDLAGKAVKSGTFKLAKRYDEALIQRMEWVPVTKKTQWVCKRCGWCCSHEWRVNLTWDEYDRLKDKLPISKIVADPESGMSHPFYMIKDKCKQYDTKKHNCHIYKIRAYTCATYPFALTPEGKLVRSKFCKGFGKGENISPKKMKEYILKRRRKAGMKV